MNIYDGWFEGGLNCTILVAKTKALISFTVTAKLICPFIFAYADCCFSHAMALLNSHETGKYQGKNLAPSSLSNMTETILIGALNRGSYTSGHFI